jgi:hypothetical protein
MVAISLQGQPNHKGHSDHRFFTTTAGLIALSVVGGFGTWALTGHVDIATTPLLVHAHGVLFMGWTFLYLAQNALILRGDVAMHRRLGWAGVALACLIVPVGAATAINSLITGRVPSFFTPPLFLVLSALELITFSVLFGAAIYLRRQTQWHRRLMFCATLALFEPAWGRLFNLAGLGDLSGPAIAFVQLAFIAAGAIYDARTLGRPHPAYGWGTAAIILKTIGIPTLSMTPMAISTAAMLTGPAGP